MSPDASLHSCTRESQTLYDLILPGTHDSAAYFISTDKITRASWKPLHFRPIRWALRDILIDFARTQSLNFYEQLRSGARFLDLRVSKLAATERDDRFWTVHGMMPCVPLDDFFRQINRFHRENSQAGSTVPVVVSVRTFYLNSEETEKLSQSFDINLEHKHFTGSAADLRSTPVEQLPPNIIVGVRRLSHLEDYRFATDDWINTYNPQVKLAGLKRQVCSLARPRSERNNLYVLGFTVTPHFWDVFTRIATAGLLRPSVQDSAIKMNRIFPSFMSEHEYPVAQNVNVIFFDFFTKVQSAFFDALNEPSMGF